ncbi:uncharacterized protein LOC143358156 isoform X1 [Halictus rubicundus]|uniref:uncharacterized protein LOC143358156 isoform X1 n=1 Tax=Halictus rubicundus TaxID=77578 RepID=UPI00403502DD
MVQNCPLILFSTRFQDVVQEDGRFECGDGNGGNAKTDDEKENNRTGETRSEERGQANREEAKRRRGRGQRTSELKERKRTGENRRETGSRKGRQLSAPPTTLPVGPTLNVPPTTTWFAASQREQRNSPSGGSRRKWNGGKNWRAKGSTGKTMRANLCDPNRKNRRRYPAAPPCPNRSAPTRWVEGFCDVSREMAISIFTVDGLLIPSTNILYFRGEPTLHHRKEI